MCKHSLYSLALISFSLVSNVAAVPMDADYAMSEAIQNAVLHKEVAVVQGGGSDKDVGDALTATNTDKCEGDNSCTKDKVQYVVIGDTPIYINQSVSDWFEQDSPATLHLLMAWLTLLSVGASFIFRKSLSAK